MSEVMTVRGPVAADQLGRTLMHEHLFIDLARITRNFDHFLHDVSLAVVETARFRDAGGATIVDLTNRNLGRNPLPTSTTSTPSPMTRTRACCTRTGS